MKKDAPIYTVAIDPSINNLGLAVFIDNKLESFQLLHPNRENADGHYLVKSRDMCNKVRLIYQKIKSFDAKTMLVTEVPEHFGVSGFISRETGSIFKLTFVCGMIYSIAPDTVAYQPSKWKGQMSKEVVRNRLLRDYPEHDIKVLDHNIVDAIGIGHKYIFGSV